MTLTIKRIDELSRKDILSDIDPRTLQYSKDVKNVKYVGITRDYILVFETPSVTANPPTTYTQRISLKDLSDIINEKDLDIREKVRLAIAGDIGVSCTCPAYKWWGYEYIMTELDSKEGNPQDIFPKVRNPELEGTVCKHLKVAIQSFVMNWAKIAKDIKDKNYL